MGKEIEQVGGAQIFIVKKYLKDFSNLWLNPFAFFSVNFM